MTDQQNRLNGTRHSNGGEAGGGGDGPNRPSFRTQLIHTNAEDIARKECPQLSPNLIQEPYDSTDHYLRTQFGLLREELVRPMVDDVRRLRDKLTTFDKDNHLVTNSGRNYHNNNKTVREVVESDRDIQSNVYFKVRLASDWTENCCHRRFGPILRFNFDYQSIMAIDLKDCQRLMDGSLLCLSSDQFENSMIFGVVYKSRLGVYDNETKQNVWDFCLKVDLDNDVCREFFDIILNPNADYVAIESLAYLEAMTHTMAKLQTMGDDFPFKRYIVDLKKDIKAPPYLRSDSCYDMTCIAPDPPVDPQTVPQQPQPNPLPSVQLMNNDSKSMAKKSSIFDSQQFESFFAALTREFAVIQGPPGTGKTFVGLKIVRCLLDNEKVWNPTGDRRPILIVCFKNHALDQFLEGIVKFTKYVVRIGSKSESKALEKHKIFEIQEKFKSMRKGHKSDQSNQESDEPEEGFPIEEPLDPFVLKDLTKTFKSYGRINGISGRMEEIFETINKSFNEILDYDLIEPFIMPMKTKFINFFGSNPLFEWLNGENQALVSMRLKVRLPTNRLYDKIFGYLRELKATNGLDFDLNELSPDKRWTLYLYWRENFFGRMQTEISGLRQSLMNGIKKLNKREVKFRRGLCGKAQVVGMTITGAAKYTELVDAFNPSIMIIEEAAEVLEGHLVSSFPTRVQHVILVGDHKQLRPITNVRELTTDYQMDTSLFERMVTNGMPFEQLSLQFRMRPCISELLKVANFYDNLRNAPKVTIYPDIKYTFNKNMLFVDHKHFEDNNNCREVVDKSRSNLYEAKLVVELVKYFLLHGYPAKSITVLATYNAQTSLIRRLMLDEKLFVKEVDVDPVRPKPMGKTDVPKESAAELKVRVSSADGFQGEENDIIIISFVRSSKKGTIGFLENRNRVNVALSRARHALYCVGNFETMAAADDDMWRRIVDHLHEKDYINHEFVIGCECTGEEHIEMPGQFELLNLQIRNGRCKCRTPTPTQP